MGWPTPQTVGFTTWSEDREAQKRRKQEALAEQKRQRKVQAALAAHDRAVAWRSRAKPVGWVNEYARLRGRRLTVQWLATPPWQSKAELLVVYDECRAVSAATGVAHHVDHIIPVIHEQVCGLHVPWNLRIIPAKANLAKSNVWSDEVDNSSVAQPDISR